MVAIQDLINQSVREDRIDKEQRHWNISRLGNCPTGQYLERLGKEPDEPLNDRTLRVFNVGKVFEDWLVDLVAKQGVEHRTQIHVEDQALDISGYADLGVTFENNLEVIYEVKSRMSRAFWWMVKEGKPSRHHEIQLWWYLKLLNLPLGILVYVSRDDLEIKEYPVMLNNAELETEAMTTLSALNEAWRTKQAPQFVPDETNKWWERYCSFHRQCMEYAVEAV